MSEAEETGGTVVELMLLEPEIVAWLEDYRPEDHGAGGRRAADRGMSRPNVYADGPWDMEAEKMQIRSLFVGLASGAKELGASMHELLPGSSGFNLHTHYAIEELFVVLAGRPTLRTPENEEQLEPGDVVCCPRGRDGMHTFANRTDRAGARARDLDRAVPRPGALPGAGQIRRGHAPSVRAGDGGRRPRSAGPVRAADR